MDIYEEQKLKELTLLIDIAIAKPTLNFPTRELRTYMESIFSMVASPTMFHVCEWVTHEMFEKILKNSKFRENEKYRAIEDIFSIKGWGELEFLDSNIKDTKFRIKVEKCFECEEKKSLIKDCYMSRGLLTGALSALFNRKIITVEIKCRFRENDFCEFIAFPITKSENVFSTFSIKNYDQKKIDRFL